jgi:hypothetical protein
LNHNNFFRSQFSENGLFCALERNTAINFWGKAKMSGLKIFNFYENFICSNHFFALAMLFTSLITRIKRFLTSLILQYLPWVCINAKILPKVSDLKYFSLSGATK